MPSAAPAASTAAAICPRRSPVARPDLVGRPLAFESFYHFVEFPKLNVEAINERLGLLSGASFIFASQIDPVVNVAVWTRMKARYSGMVLRCLLRLL